MIPRIWRLSETSDHNNLGLACTDQGLLLGRTPLIERRDGRFVVRERSEIECLFSLAYGREATARRLMGGLATVASALNANDQGLARIAAVHLRIPDLPDRAARDLMEAADVLIKYARDEGGGDWNPALHPRTGTPPNPGWFAPTDGGGTQLAGNDEKRPPLLGGGGGGGGGFGRGDSSYTGEPAVPVWQGGRPNLHSILVPGGELIGEPGSGVKIRTVSPEEFESLRFDLLEGAGPVSGPDSYKGMAFERPDGSVIGIRNSLRYGTTIDVLQSTSHSIPNGFRIHKK
ncbi:MAG TPA: hypothetical protein VK337_08500 [Xanthobacteraceae bacterium]|nr:hypothetical protein [Xanthobacteraceae bacterium]